MVISCCSASAVMVAWAEPLAERLARRADEGLFSKTLSQNRSEPPPRPWPKAGSA
jgi:hypothetical protein